MVRHIGVHRSDHAHIVDHLTDVRKQLTDFDAALAIFFEFEGRTICSSGFTFRSQVIWDGLTVKLVEGWLGVKCINLGRTTVHEQVNNRFGLRLKMRILRKHRVRVPLPIRLPTRQRGIRKCVRIFGIEHARQRECSESGPASS